jgi:CheY-like chemotaxis protein
VNHTLASLSQSPPDFFVYADDDEDAIMLLRVALRKLRAPISLVACSDGRSFIDLMTNTINNALRLPRFILLDLEMPCVGGLEALGWLRKVPTLKEIPVYLFSSSPKEEDMRLALALGATDYLIKPGSFDDLCKELSRLLLRSEIPLTKPD